jgi:hypothetical protein
MSNFRFRTSFLGCLILQRKCAVDGPSEEWVDANANDLQTFLAEQRTEALLCDPAAAESALRRAFKEDQTAIGKLMTLSDTDVFLVTRKTEYPVPAAYAKTVLRDYLSQELKT